MWLLILIMSSGISNGIFSSSMAAPTSSGPTSDEEAEIIWTEGQKALEESRYQASVNYLQRSSDPGFGFEFGG